MRPIITSKNKLNLQVDDLVKQKKLELEKEFSKNLASERKKIVRAFDRKLEEEKEKLNKLVENKVDTLLAEERRWKSGDDFRGDFLDKIYGNDSGDLNTFLGQIRESEGHNKFLFQKYIAENYPTLKNVSESLYYTWGGFYPAESANPTEEEVKFFQKVISTKWRYSPIIRNFVNGMRMYTVGKGAIVECAANKYIDRRVSDILNYNRFDVNHKIWVADLARDGEIYLQFFFDRMDKKLWIEQIDARRVVDIERHPENSRIEIGYEISRGSNKTDWIPSIQFHYKDFDSVNSYDSKKVKRTGETAILHIKDGDQKSLRGTPRLEPVLKWSRIEEELDLDLVRYLHERVRIPWIETLLNEGARSATRTSDRTKGSATKIEIKGRNEWRMEDPKVNQVEWRFWGRTFKLKVCAGLDFPEFILYMDSSGQNYSSYRKADSPFVRMILDNQDFWATQFRTIAQIVVRYLKELEEIKDFYVIDDIHMTSIQETIGLTQLLLRQNNSNTRIVKEVLESQITEENRIKVSYKDIPFNVVFPTTVGEDNILLLSQAIQILLMLGVLSKKTASRMVGLDSRAEQFNMKSETPPQGELQNPNPAADDTRNKDFANRSENDYLKRQGKPLKSE
ncbi:MAG: hypothetical protein ACFE95_13460 [Candidatus Hodarchaeota archaeon]